MHYFDIGKPNEAIHYLDSAFNQIKHPFINDRVRVYSIKFVYHRKTSHNLKKTLLYADSMLIMAKKSINPKQYALNYADANFALGDAYFDLSQYNEAYQCYYQGYFIGKNNLNNAVLAEYTYRMGMVTFKQSHFKLAANYFKDSFRQSMSYKNDFVAFYQRQEILDNIGESYKNNGDIDSASLYFSKALDFINAHTDQFKARANMLEIARGVVYGNQGDIAISKGQYKLAEKLLKKSIAINLKPHSDNFNAELTEINLGKLYLNTHQYSAFIKLFNNLRNQLDSVKNEEAETNWNLLLSKYYTQKKDLARALVHLQNYNSLKDSVNKRSGLLKETDISQQQANYDKQYQIESLRDNNKLQLIYIYLAIISAIMAVIIVFLVFRNWRKSKKDIVVVSALNKQISQQKTNLENTLAKLKASSQEKDRILRTVAHDLRNPLGGIASLTNAMLTDEEYTEEQQELIRLINETSYNSLELINEIIEATNNVISNLNMEMVDINLLVNNSVELLRFKAAEKNQRIIVDLLEKPEKLYISREKIWRVLSNLISNAIKFSPADTDIHINISTCTDSVKITIKDKGIGIPDDLKQQVFNMFTDAKRPGTSGEKSFGLGLFICQQIIEMHKGKLWFESSVASGTTFFITLNKPDHFIEV